MNLEMEIPIDFDFDRLTTEKEKMNIAGKKVPIVEQGGLSRWQSMTGGESTFQGYE